MHHFNNIVIVYAMTAIVILTGFLFLSYL